MTPLLTARLIIAASGVLVWAYGAREDYPTARWIGIGIIVVAMLLKLAGGKTTNSADDSE
jgi:hypothetical protein